MQLPSRGQWCESGGRAHARARLRPQQQQYQGAICEEPNCSTHPFILKSTESPEGQNLEVIVRLGSASGLWVSFSIEKPVGHNFQEHALRGSADWAGE